MRFSSRSTIGAGMPSGGLALMSGMEAVAEGAIDGVEAAEESLLGVIGRVEGAFTAMESPDAAVCVEAVELDRSRLAASRGRDVGVPASGSLPILDALSSAFASRVLSAHTLPRAGSATGGGGQSRAVNPWVQCRSHRTW